MSEADIDTWIDRLSTAAFREAVVELDRVLGQMLDDPYRHNRDNWNGHVRRITEARRRLAESMKEPT
jgi:hypothetical protein